MKGWVEIGLYGYNATCKFIANPLQPHSITGFGFYYELLEWNGYRHIERLIRFIGMKYEWNYGNVYALH